MDNPAAALGEGLQSQALPFGEMDPGALHGPEAILHHPSVSTEGPPPVSLLIRSLAAKAREETAQLRQRLLDLAGREASVRTDIYQMLEIVTSIAGDLEDAGDDLVKEFGQYKLGRKSYHGGSFIGGLVQAVIRFINRWTHTKERVMELDQKRQEFIEKTRDLPPLSPTGHDQRGPVNQSVPGIPAPEEESRGPNH